VEGEVQAGSQTERGKERERKRGTPVTQKQTEK
jgi:hypothetical protein